MEALRLTMNSTRLESIIDLPMSLQDCDVEVIVLPCQNAVNPVKPDDKEPKVESIMGILKQYANPFWHQKSVDELADEQGVGPVNDLGRLFGCGKDLWETTSEWNEYMGSIQAGRRE